MVHPLANSRRYSRQFQHSPKEGNALDYIHRQFNNNESEESAGFDKGQGYSNIPSTVFGFVINWEKFHLEPTQTLEYLWMLIASVTMTLSHPERKLVAIIQKCQCLFAKTVVTIREVSGLIGISTAGARAVLSASLHYRRSHMTKIDSL